MRLAVIPARGGSKRIPKKNIKQFCGKPIVCWSIEAARSSGCFDKVIVSTDDETIAEISQEAGAYVPFARPAELSDDHTSTGAVVSHCIRWALKESENIDFVCCIYATAPFVTPDLLRLALSRLEVSGKSYCFPVTRYSHPIQRALKINSDNELSMIDPSMIAVRTQDLEETYHDVGQFYWGTSKAWLSGEPILGGRSVPIVLSNHEVKDIDHIDDWKHAEEYFKIQMQHDEKF
jgi:pseudaminic acid cytidylyltransferase